MRARAERPNAGDRAEQRRFAGAGRTADQHALARLDRRCRWHSTSGAPFGSRTARSLDRDDGAAVAGSSDLDTGGVTAAACAAGDRGIETGKPFDHGAPFGERAIGIDEERQRALHAAEGRSGLHQPAKLDRAGEIGRADHDEGKNRSRPASSRRSGTSASSAAS